MKLSSAVIGIAKLLLTLSAAVVVDGQSTDNGTTFVQPGYAVGSFWELGNIIQDTDDPNINYLGGLRFFTAADGSSFLCIVEDAEEGDAGVYCMDIQRDAITGCVTSISNTTGPSIVIVENGVNSTISSKLDLVTQGPDDFDYVTFFDDTIAQATWEFDLETEKPNTLNIVNRMDLSSISRDGAFGLEFSSIAEDPNNAGRPLLFATGSLELISIPFNSPTTVDSPATIDYDKAEFICKMPSYYSGDIRTISTGDRTNDFLVIDYDTSSILILKIDKATGYPVGYNTTNPTYYTTCYEPGTYNNCTTRTNRFNDKVAENPLDCPLEPFLNTNDQPWGMNFDGNTGDFFFTNWGSDYDTLIRIKGFAPGFNPAVVVQALQDTMDALFDILNSGRRIRRLNDDPGATFAEIRRRLQTKSPKAARSPKATKSAKGFKGAKGTKGSSGVPAEAPSSTAAELLESLGAPGSYQVSDEVLGSLAYLKNTDSPAFKAAISGRGPSDDITITITNVVAAVQGLVDATFPTGTTLPPLVDTKVKCLECLGKLFEEIDTGAVGVDCSTCQQ